MPRKFDPTVLRWRADQSPYGAWRVVETGEHSAFALPVETRGEEGLANARLMAAAPDLLVACRTALACVGNTNPDLAKILTDAIKKSGVT